MGSILEKKRRPFTMILTEVIRDHRLDPYDKTIYCCINSCGTYSFPSYTILRRWSGMARARISKSLKNLERFGLIKRFTDGRRIHYKVIGIGTWKIQSGKNNKIKEVKFKMGPVHQEDCTSSPGEPISVHGANSNYTHKINS